MKRGTPDSVSFYIDNFQLLLPSGSNVVKAIACNGVIFDQII